MQPFADPARTQAFRTVEMAAERIGERPQTGQDVVKAIRVLAQTIERWRLIYLWEYLQFDAAAEPNRLIGVHQNLGAALNGIARELKLERLGPVALAASKRTIG